MFYLFVLVVILYGAVVKKMPLLVIVRGVISTVPCFTINICATMHRFTGAHCTGGAVNYLVLVIMALSAYIGAVSMWCKF